MSKPNEFYSLLELPTINSAGEDHWLWLEDESTLFTVKSTYLAMYDLRIGSCEMDVFKNFGKSIYSTKGVIIVVENIFR